LNGSKHNDFTFFSPEIYSKMGYKKLEYPHHIDSLYREMDFLWKYGYVSRSKPRPFIYGLTKKGEEHAENPLISRDRIGKLVRDNVESILSNDEKFMKAVVNYSSKYGSGGSFGDGNVVVLPHNENDVVEPKEKMRFIPVDVPTTNEDNNNGVAPIRIINGVPVHVNYQAQNQPQFPVDPKDLEIETLRRKVKDLELQVFYQNVNIQPTRYVDDNGQEIKPEIVAQKTVRYQNKKAMLDVQAKRRKQLASGYIGYQLDSYFFEQWGTVHPYWIKHFGFFKKGSVEVLSPSNSEVRIREHTKGKLTPQQIMIAQFQIIKTDAKGIHIMCIGMKEPGYMKY